MIAYFLLLTIIRVDFSPFFYISCRTNVPVHQVYLGGREQATSPSAYIHQQTTISRGIASGEMKIDPVTNKYVPNDIFVQAMGPGGVLPDCPPLKKHSK